MQSQSLLLIIAALIALFIANQDVDLKNIDNYFNSKPNTLAAKLSKNPYSSNWGNGSVLEILSNNSANKALFVATNGDDNSDGKSEQNPLRSIAKAVSIAKAGQTIYVKAGTYNGEQIVFANSGQRDAKIILEGYQFKPADRPSYPNFNEASAFDPSKMPLLDGGNRAAGTAILIEGKYIEIRNLQIKNYENGIMAYAADHLSVSQVYLANLGINDETVYSGIGLRFGSKANSSSITNTVVVNAGAEGISYFGDNGLISGCRVYSQTDFNNHNSTDYYIVLEGNHNTIENSQVFRIGEQYHVGHGIGLKAQAEDNIIRNNLAVGFKGAAYYLRHRGVKNNLLLDNLAQNGDMGIAIRDGASFNIIENLQTQNIKRPIVFFDTDEDGGKQFSGNDNIIRNSVFTNSQALITMDDYIYSDVFASRNIIEDNVINKAQYLFDLRSSAFGNVFRHNNLNDVQEFAHFTDGKIVADIGFSFVGNSILNSGFSLP